MAWLVPGGVGCAGGVAVRALVATGRRAVVFDRLSMDDLARLRDPDHVALRSDHWRSRVSTPRVLDRLAAQAVRSAFFLVGAMAGGRKSTLAALQWLLAHCPQRGLWVGPLSEHGGE